MAQAILMKNGGGSESNCKLAFATRMRHYESGFSVKITLNKECEILDAQAKCTYEGGNENGHSVKVQTSINNSNWVDYAPNVKAKYIKATHSGSQKIGNTVSLAVLYKE